MNMKSNLAHEPLQPQGEVVRFPKKERQAMSNKDVSYTKTPNYLVDEDYVARMTGNALKCYTIINRFTEGFSRSNWAIDSSFLLEKTGIKKPHTAYDAVKQLEEFGLLSVHREDGRTNKFTIAHPCQKMAVVPNLGSAEKGNKGDAEKRHNPTAEKRHTKKETFKENIKETHIGEKAPEIFDQDDSWKPNPNFLKTILLQTKFSNRADEIISVPDFNFHLGNFNAHWENKIDLTENQKTRKFAAWLVQEFEKQISKANRSEKQKASYQPASSKNSQTMRAHDEFFAQYGIGSTSQESDFIDVHSSEIKTIGGNNQ